jgi:threonine-phosphate decarboxylase
MTKHFSIPGLRLGYVVGNKGIVSELFSFQPPWSVNSLAIAAGHFLLNHHQLCSIDISGWIDESKKLGQSLADITGWEAYPSSTAYFLMKTTIPSAIIKHELIGCYGILIRDASNFRGLDDYHVRICSQDESKNRLLVDAVKDLFGSVPKV